MILPVIIAGGSGTRLWPLSRKSYPKQFINIFGNNSMFQDTLLRLDDLDCYPAQIICSKDYRFLINDQLQEINIRSGSIILEPVGRNTAPAIALAALQALSEYKNPTLLVLPSDHIIPDKRSFIETIKLGDSLADKDKIVTFGINPTEANTGYGYIKTKEKNTPALVEKFVEKPSLDIAEQYLKSGNFYWNSGIFMFKAETYLEELELHCPEILSMCKQAFQNQKKEFEFIVVDENLFKACPAESIDNAVMEKAKEVWVVPMNTAWNDLGSWSSVKNFYPKDINGNTFVGDVLHHDTKNSYVLAKDKLVTTVGVEDLIIIETSDAILVTKPNHDQGVRKITEQLQSNGVKEYEFHPEVHRPWGRFHSIERGRNYQVKRIMVKSGHKLSLQKHKHRSEHWVVVSGTATVTKDNEQHTLHENESIYLPIGCIHSLENREKEPLVIIEVQSGSYLGEDDIIRLDDLYGRS